MCWLAAAKLDGTDVIDLLSDLFILRGVPGHVRSDNVPEFVAKAVQTWIMAVGAKTAYIAPGSPWEPGRTAPSRASTRSSATSCSTARSQETQDFGRNYAASSVFAFYYQLYVGLDAYAKRSMVFDGGDLQRFKAAISEFGKMLPQDTKDQIWSEVAAQTRNQPVVFQECVKP